MFAVLSHVHSRKPAPGRMPNAACGTQALPVERFLRGKGELACGMYEKSSLLGYTFLVKWK